VAKWDWSQEGESKLNKKKGEKGPNCLKNRIRIEFDNKFYLGLVGTITARNKYGHSNGQGEKTDEKKNKGSPLCNFYY
tara:strand:- start:436 stop:669 length:234 start_codon:yes stop_codon:yes gene_type:complete